MIYRITSLSENQRLLSASLFFLVGVVVYWRYGYLSFFLCLRFFGTGSGAQLLALTHLLFFYCAECNAAEQMVSHQERENGNG